MGPGSGDVTAVRPEKGTGSAKWQAPALSNPNPQQWALTVPWCPESDIVSWDMVTEQQFQNTS